MIASGTFQITMTPEPPIDVVDGVSIGRVLFEKRFTGGLTAESRVHMTAARTPVADSAGYVAVERIVGTLDGRRGSFVVVHTGLMSRGQQSLRIEVVPDTATGELAGLSGTMTITIVERQHHYRMEYELPTG